MTILSPPLRRPSLSRGGNKLKIHPVLLLKVAKEHKNKKCAKEKTLVNDLRVATITFLKPCSRPAFGSANSELIGPHDWEAANKISQTPMWWLAP